MTAVLPTPASATGDRALAPPHPTPVSELPEDPVRTLIDLHFTARERIADLLTRPTSPAMTAVHTAVEHFLDTERRLVLAHPAVLAELGLELRDVVIGRRAVLEALDPVAWSDSASSALTLAVEALRLAFLDHAARFDGRRARPPSTPAGHPCPSRSPAW